MGTSANQDPNQSNQYGGYSGYSGNTQSSQSQPQYNPDDPYGASTVNEPASATSGSQQQTSGGQQQQQQSYADQQQQQQQYSYQPPRSAVERQQAYDQTSTGMSARRAAVWSYALGPLSGIYFFIRERKNRFVRFSAAQSTLFSLSVLVLAIVLFLLSKIAFIGFLIGLFGCVFNVIFIALAVVWVFLMIQASRGVKFKLPILGNYAERLQGKKGQ
ncbi:DUF4870 domain-containing protein [Ktedonospora formicarum]|uniref:DUF4870 domain-containing protein n=1 Tax=Ktedonospora formicarum TaxID=2778364 RepID=A0A8J3HWM2_9CHLR|nr:DUF4870 domain-containing protein [Ktedonospora formicarum]GHO43366.1 hypothetical protein KSX_15290 [Ktedonospora formicarum]